MVASRNPSGTSRPPMRENNGTSAVADRSWLLMARRCGWTGRRGLCRSPRTLWAAFNAGPHDAVRRGADHRRE